MMNFAKQECHVYIVDDVPAALQRLSLLLATSEDSDDIARPSVDFLERFRAGSPTRAAEKLKQPDDLQQRRMLVPFVLLVVNGKDELVADSRRITERAVDFNEGRFESPQLLGVIERALNREDTAVADAARRAEAIKRINRLTPREREVMELVAAGKLNKVIAYELGITSRTVEAHRAKVMEKTETRSVAELMRLIFLAR